MPVKNYLAMLIQGLEKKRSLLDEIVELNERQQDILRDNNSLPEDLEDSVNRKSDCVDAINALDEGFEEVFSRVKETLEKDRASYGQEIKTLQGLIREVTERGARIRSQEERNFDLARNKFTYIKEQVQKITKSQNAVNKYYNNMMKVNYVDPQFLDNKK